MGDIPQKFYLVVYSLVDPVSPGDSFQIHFSIRNERNEPFKGGFLKIAEDKFFQQSLGKVPPLEPYSKTTDVYFLVHTNKVRTLEISNTIAVTLIEGKDKEILKLNFTLRLSNFIKPLYRPVPAPYQEFNILLFGLAGAAKSSFINSIFTLISRNNYISTRASVGGNLRHVTSNLIRYQLNSTDSSDSMKGLKVNLWDTWGLTPSTYKGSELEAIIRGKLPAGWKMMDTVDNNADRLAECKGTAEKRKIHAVLYLVPQAIINDPNSKKTLDLVKDVFLQIKQLGYNPLVLITMADEVVEQIRQKPNQQYPQLNNLRSNLSKTLGIGTGDIFFSVNYTTETQRETEIDKLNYTILEIAIKRASDFITNPVYQGSKEEEEEEEEYNA